MNNIAMKRSLHSVILLFGRPRALIAVNQFQAFTLVEILVASALLGIIMWGVASTLGVGLSSLVTTTSRTDFEIKVDQDLAAIKDVAYRLTCCPGTCTADQVIVNDSVTCSSKTPGSQNYYFPLPSEISDADTSQISAFKARCAAAEYSGSLVESLVDAIGDAPISGIERSFDTSEASRHRLIVNYSSNGISKGYVVTPAASAWCP